MLTDIEHKRIILTLDELLSYSFPCGSLVRERDFYEKPKLAQSIAEDISDSGKFMLSHAFSASYSYDGYTYDITALPDLCAIYNDHVEIINVRASGGKRTASDLLLGFWQRQICACAAICADAVGVSGAVGSLLYSTDSKLPPEQTKQAPDYETARAVLFEIIEKAARLIMIQIEKKTLRMPCAHKAPFPFASKRAGQSDFMTSVLYACKNGTKLLSEAPTGIG